MRGQPELVDQICNGINTAKRIIELTEEGLRVVLVLRAREDLTKVLSALKDLGFKASRSTLSGKAMQIDRFNGDREEMAGVLQTALDMQGGMIMLQPKRLGPSDRQGV